MNRKTLDKLLAAGGVVITAVLLVAAALLFWAHSFVDDQVHSQLSAQQIYFPAQGSDSLQDPKVGPYLTKYAGQQLVDGAQAQAYADHFIAVHIAEMAGGQTYAQLSSKSLAAPNDTALAAKVQTVFRGETLRGLLLNAYAFWKMGQIALWAALVSVVGAAAMAELSILGFMHARRVADSQTRTAFAPTREPAAT
jgi:hypothetical protein